MLHRCIGVAGLALMAACERPTAPEARDLAGRLSDSLKSGRGYVILPQFEHTAAALAYGEQRPVLDVLRDGMRSTFAAFVIESVFIPPTGPGRVVRRSVFAWPEDKRTYLVARAHRHPTVVTRTAGDEDRTSNWSGPRNFVLFSLEHAGNWASRSGAIDIGEGVKDHDCPIDFKKVDGGAETIERVTCEIVLYPVRLAGEFVNSDDALHMPEAMLARHRLEVPRQVVLGVRFTTYCRETVPNPLSNRPAEDCASNLVAFWGDSRFFAPSLEVDVDKMSLTASGHPFRRIVPGVIPQGPNGPSALRWTLYTPSGAVVERGSASNETTGNWPSISQEMWHILAETNPAWPSRTQFLVPERLVHPGASAFSMLVLVLEWQPLG